MSARRFAGRVALVTGAAGGIGRAVVERLAREGARVGVADVKAEGAHDVAAAVTDADGEALALTFDVADRGQVSAAVEALVARFGRLDVLVNNAAVGRPVSFLDTTDEDWQAVLAVNLTGYFVVAQEAARRMVGQAAGRIVNVASLSAHIGSASQAAYAAAKGGVVALTQVMAFELAPLGIAVNAVSPGPIETPLTRSMLTPDGRRAREDRIPLGRLGLPDEVAATIVFLASEDASYVNGEVLVVDSGLLRAGLRM